MSQKNSMWAIDAIRLHVDKETLYAYKNQNYQDYYEDKLKFKGFFFLKRYYIL